MDRPTALSCRICSAPLGDVLLQHHVPDRFERAVGIATEGYRRRWQRCTGCGVVQNVQDADNERRLDALAASYYEVDLGNDLRGKFDRVMAMPPGSSDNAGRVLRVHEFVRRHVDAGTGRHVIDIGAGLGVFLARFLPLAGPAWRGTAIEPDPQAASHLRSLGAFGVVEAVFNGTEDDIADADLITLNKVVEHISDPVGLLVACGRKLTRSGILYLEVPDEWTIGRRPPSDNILGALHKHLYAPLSFSRLIERAGLDVLRTGRVFEPSGKITVFAFARRQAGGVQR